METKEQHTLTPSQQAALAAVEGGENILITGQAGTGKSFLIEKIQEDRPWLSLTATTGIAANNIGGVTINSWAGLGLGKEDAETCLKKMGQETYQRIRQADTLVIDEVSMMSKGLVDLLDAVMSGVRESDEPFGGVQMIFVGDFLQLPPVAKQGSPKFAFDSDAWAAAEIRVCVLKEVVRQKDQEFRDILAALREGRDFDYSPLMERIGTAPNEGEEPPIKLYTHNKNVDAANLIELNSLPGTSTIYEAEDGGAEKLLKDSMLPASLHLKPGARVMCLINAGPLYNGQLGTVVSCGDDVDPRVEFNGETYRVPRVTREVTRGFETLKVARQEENGVVKWLDEKGRVADPRLIENGTITLPRVVASRRQHPLRLAYAATVHKSQGLTLSEVMVDLGKAFADGQVYTALSRCRSLEHLYISRLGDISINDRALAFYKNAS